MKDIVEKLYKDFFSNTEFTQIDDKSSFNDDGTINKIDILGTSEISDSSVGIFIGVTPGRVDFYFQNFESVASCKFLDNLNYQLLENFFDYYKKIGIQFGLFKKVIFPELIDFSSFHEDDMNQTNYIYSKKTQKNFGYMILNEFNEFFNNHLLKKRHSIEITLNSRLIDNNIHTFINIVLPFSHTTSKPFIIDISEHYTLDDETVNNFNYQEKIHDICVKELDVLISEYFKLPLPLVIQLTMEEKQSYLNMIYMTEI